MSATSSFLEKFGDKFLSGDRRPGPADRETMFRAIKPGDTVGIIGGGGGILEGRATMRNRQSGLWVLNLGGAHGTPGIATRHNTVFVTGAPALLGLSKRPSGGPLPIKRA